MIANNVKTGLTVGELLEYLEFQLTAGSVTRESPIVIGQCTPQPPVTGATFQYDGNVQCQVVLVYDDGIVRDFSDVTGDETD
jgi:hypothetical protein